MKENKLHIVDIYNNVKKKYPKKIILFQIGSFYEIFGDDAKKCALILGIKQTAKKHNEATVPMCGFPIKSKIEHIKKLLSYGLTVVVMNEDSKIVRQKKQYERTLSDIITPSTAYLNSDYSHSLLNSYIASIDKVGKNAVILFADISTGEAFIEYTKYNKYYILKKLAIYDTKEVVISERVDLELDNFAVNTTKIEDESVIDIDLSNIYGIQNVTNQEKKTIVNVFTYIHNIKNNIKFYIHEIGKRYNRDRLYVPFSTTVNLMIISAGIEQDNSLLGILDNTITPSGKRAMRYMLTNPTNIEMKFRQNFVELLIDNPQHFSKIKNILLSISDIERIVFRILNHSATNEEYTELIKSLHFALEFYNFLKQIYPVEKILCHEKQIENIIQLIDEIYTTQKDDFVIKDKKIIKKVDEFIDLDIIILKKLSLLIGKIDALTSMACISKEKGWIRPTIVDENIIEIVDGYHPIYQHLKNHTVCNDFTSNEDQNNIIITGPNMSGKSMYMKQVGIISFMAQIGCFVPCKSMKISCLDAIITRMGSYDNLIEDKSTFYVEMEDIADMTFNSTQNSLCLIDEIGRGTNFEDGMEISFRILKYLIEYNKPHIITSTHIQKLTELANEFLNVQNFHFEATFDKVNEIFFDYKLKKGVCKQSSLSKNVAKILNLPKEIWKD